MASKRKRIVACDLCRERKVKCNGELPCTNCLDRGENCFLSDRRARRPLYPTENDPVTQRLSRIEALLDDRAGRQTEPATVSSESTGLAKEPQTQASQTINRKPEQPQAPSTPPHSSLISLHLAPERKSPAWEDGSVYSADTSNLEYVGPRTFLSVCSVPAISWISNQLQDDSFQPVAARLLRDITMRLRPSKSLPLERKPEPSAEDAWRYTAAYFAEAPEAAFGVVNRARFEGMLRKHFQGRHSVEYDAAWYALRNIIFAYGCRISMSKTATFQKANHESQGWFFNALAAHTDLLYFRTSIMGVQALTLMAYFTETLGGPSLQHMLIACAVRLAFAKGLHRQPCPSWKLHSEESAHRSWIFWAVYCLDKHISVRSGRPSAVDDEEVSCPIPTSSPTTNTANIWYCTTMVKMAKLLSRVVKELSSATAMGQRPEYALNRVKSLDEELQAFADSLQNVLDLKQSSHLTPRMEGLTMDQALRARLMYFEVVFALHSTISRPWLRLVCPRQAESAPYQHQVLYSSEVAASAARSVILACSNMHLSAQCPHWYALSVPMTACINLFVHILQYPDRPVTQSDLSLLDVGAGHFARLDFASQSIMSHSFAREIAQLARILVMKAAPTAPHATNALSASNASHQPLQSAPASDVNDHSTGLSGEFDLETWFNMEMWLPIES